MDDLLKRLLEIDRQGDDAVKAAEEQAVKMREESAAQLAARNADFAKALSEQCAVIEQHAVTEAEARRRDELAQADQKVARQGEAFAAALKPLQGKFLDELLGLTDDKA